MINILDSKIYNRISAGEVVDKPASVVKELVENSIDAKATSITVEVESGGISKICVIDDGVGIEKEDISLAFMPHATSKISNISDLDSIATLGFRGEALASISSVCHMFLSTKTEKEQSGYSITVDGGEFSAVREIAKNRGTTISASNLFYNTPVRRKFLRKEKQEENEITFLMQKFMLSNPEISFNYYIDKKLAISVQKQDLKERIYGIYGREIYENLLKIDHVEGGYKISGYITNPLVSKPNRTYQSLFVNSRYVENYMISSAVSSVYEHFLMKGRFPIFVLNIETAFENVDVNVHPTKKEVKFENSSFMFGFIRRACEKALEKSNNIASLPINDEVVFKIESVKKKPLEILEENEGSSFVKEEKINIDIIKDIENREQIKESKSFPNFDAITLSEKIVENKNRFIFDQKKDNPAQELSYKPTSIIQDELFQNENQSFNVKGCVFNTYIIVEQGKNLFLIDQHASHERQLYDKLVEIVKSQKTAKQNLLIPFSYEMNETENNIYINSKTQIEKLGFETSVSGKTLRIDAVPLILENINLSEFCNDVFSIDQAYFKNTEEILQDKLAQKACKSAIKGGDVISNEQIAYLLEEMKKGVLLCPHGRPIVLKVTRQDIDKLFKRIL